MHLSRSVIFCLVILMCLGSACGPNKAITPVAAVTTPVDVNPPTASPLVLPTLPPTSTAAPVQAVVFDSTVYTHPQKLFSLQVPAGLVVSETAHSATFTDVGVKSVVYIEAINTGYLIDAEAFGNLIDNREIERSFGFEIYIEIDRKNFSASNAVLVTKQVSNLVDGQTLSTLYQQQGPAILIMDILADQSRITNYQEFSDTLVNSVKVNPGEVSKLSLYSFDHASLHNNGLFSILIPECWRLEQSGGENSLVETIASPDKKALVQAIVYDDGQRISKSVAGELVLTLLRENYTKKISVQADDLIADGRERLTWRSPIDNYRGITTFETRGSALLILTVMWYDDPNQLYQSLLEAIIDSYKYTPAAE